MPPMDENEPYGLQRINDVELVRVGTWTGSRRITIDREMLQRLASNYAELGERVPGFKAPVKIGHQDYSGQPAMGWIDRVWVEGDTLKGDLIDVPYMLVDSIRDRRYNSVSVEIIPSYEYEGKKYSELLRAVALLGSEWPAVKGLKPLAEARLSEVQSEQWRMDMFTQEQVDALIAAAVEKAKVDLQEETDALHVKLQAETEARQAAQAEVLRLSDKIRLGEITNLVNQAIDDGRILPAQKDRFINLGIALSEQVVVTLADGKKVSANAEFEAIIKGLPKIVELKEKLAATDGEKHDSPGLEVHRLANLLVKQNKLTYTEAVKQVLAENEELRVRYAKEAV